MKVLIVVLNYRTPQLTVRCVIQHKAHDEPPRFFVDFLRNSTFAKGLRLEHKSASAGS